MFGWNESQDAHAQVYGDDGGEHEGKFSHELVAGAAAFEGFKVFEDRQRKEGKPVSHAFAKELLAGVVGGEVDKLAETKGMDEYDKIEAHRHAKKQAEQLYNDHYVDGQNADQYDPNQYSAPQQFEGRW